MLCTWIVYPLSKQLVVPPRYTPRSIGNQFLIMVQLITNRDKEHV
jgi:hypothetical protein